jgi:hypothetical protein
MSEDEDLKDWKLKLRYGKVHTPFHHFTLLAEGTAESLTDGFTCPEGPAFMGMKAWASSSDEAIEMIQNIGEQIGFLVTGKIYVYNTDPVKPPEENAYGYEINFTPISNDK